MIKAAPKIEEEKKWDEKANKIYESLRQRPL
jgi:hypothetical protein